MDPARQARILRQHVRTDQLLGVDAVPMGEIEVTHIEEAVQQEAPPATSPRPAAVTTRPPITPSAPPVMNLFGAKDPPVSPPSTPPVSRAQPMSDDQLPALPVYSKSLELDAKVHLLHNMDVNEVRGCRKCGLCNGRTQTVFGEGDPNANLLFIGEGPGENEDLQGRPFIGRAGQKLEEMIIAMGLTRKQVYIANVVKCRPPENRAPTGAEVLACWDYLKRQIETIQPRAIVTLGGPATKQILQTDRGITAIRGIWHAFDALKPAGPSIPVMPTFHPAYLLRAYTPENRKKVWSDLQQVMKLLQSPTRKGEG